MAMISDFSCDLVEEILARVPITSLGAVRSTCKRWSTLSKSRLLCKAKENHQFLGFMKKNSKPCSLRFDLHEEEEFSVKEISNQVKISEVHVCDGLLCVSVTMDNPPNLMVWNPYLGQTRWIQPRKTYQMSDKYALGYDNNHNHKILRYFVGFGDKEECEIYDFKSDTWRTLDVTLKMLFYFSASLKGNTYFVEFDMEKGYTGLFLCFDFTREIFGEKLHLPWSKERTYSCTPISCFREEKLAALLYMGSPIFGVGIWVTTKIEPNEVLWSNFLKIDLKISPRFTAHSFFIDEEKKRAVFFTSGFYNKEYYNTAYIIGENGFFKTLDLGETKCHHHFSVVCSNSYVPSLVQIKQNCCEREKRVRKPRSSGSAKE